MAIKALEIESVDRTGLRDIKKQSGKREIDTAEGESKSVGEKECSFEKEWSRAVQSGTVLSAVSVGV